MKIIVVGAVAGGATAAARLRRLSEDAEIIVFERGEHVSFANCGLPYYIGGVISRRDALFVSTLKEIKKKYALDIRTLTEVLRIDRDLKLVEVKNLATGETYEEGYDKLILSTGSSPFVPETHGIRAPNVFTIWTLSDTDRIWDFIHERNPRRALVVGGGFIGIEMAENLVERGIKVTLVELADQIMPPFDKDMTVILEDHMRKKGVRLILGSKIESISDDGREVSLSDGSVHPSDLTILSIGVRPNNQLAQGAGLELGPRGHISVNQGMQTSDPDIYAVGDVAEVDEPILGGKTVIPLAGPANLQGRFVGANLLAGEIVEAYRGSIGTSVAKIFDMTAASVGLNEKQLDARGMVYGKDYFYTLIHPMNHVTYYPGALPMVVKLFFAADGRVLGAQIVGYQGVDKRIDVIASAMHFKGGVRDLAELELAYAPPYGAAKDPVNFAGFVAENILSGLAEPVTIKEYGNNPGKYTLLDIREQEEVATGTLPGAIQIPLSQLRARLDELDPGLTYLAFCAIGLRGYVAERILKQKGFKAHHLMGGLRTYTAVSAVVSEEPVRRTAPEGLIREDESVDNGRLPAAHMLDVCGMSCPGPIVEVGKKIREIKEGEVVQIRATDPGFLNDIASWSENTGNTLLDRSEEGGYYTAFVQKGRPASSAGFAGPEDLPVRTLDVSGMSCPGPIVEVGKFIREMKEGEKVRVLATDPGFARDIESWCQNTGHSLLETGEDAGVYSALIRKAGSFLPAAAPGFVSSGDPAGKDKTIIVFSGDFDKVMAAFIIALGASAMGDKVHMFFTFWGLSTLRKDFKVPLKKSFMDKMFTGMIPRGTRGMGLSQMNMMGMAPKMMRKVMRDKGISSLEELVREAAENPDIELTACQMTMDVMGLKAEELMDGVKIGGVASMLNDADKSQFTLFIS